VAKPLDVMGVYLNPPQNAVVLCVDEKSHIQALDRTWTLHDEARALWHVDSRMSANGTTTFFATLNVTARTSAAAAFHGAATRNSCASPNEFRDCRYQILNAGETTASHGFAG
jgi:hypothetical protein